MSWFRTISSSTFITKGVQSIYIPSSIRDWYRGSQILSNRQTVFFLPVDPMDKNHKDPDTIDLLAQYMEETLKYCVLGRHQSLYKERIDILSDSIERGRSSRNTPSLLYPESCEIENWRSLIRKSIHVTSTSANDLMETRMEKRIVFITCSTIRSRATI